MRHDLICVFKTVARGGGFPLGSEEPPPPRQRKVHQKVH